MTGQKKKWAWALYDAGNSAFATVVIAGFFPVFFKTFWSSGSDVTVSTARLGLTNAVAGLVIALLAPVMGAIADSGQTKKRFLSFFTGLGIVGSASLIFVSQGNWQYAAALYAVGVIGFSGANIFYDALLPSVADNKTIDHTSALGFSLGYLGGGLLFAFCVWMTMSTPEMDSARASAVKSSFFLTAVWWAVFTVPLLLLVPEPKPVGSQRVRRPVREGIIRLWSTLREIRRIKPACIFLLAYWFYIDGVNTIIRMAVDYGMSLGINYSSLITALLITQFVGFPCALLFGKAGEKWGPKNALFVAIAGYLIIVLWGMVIRDKLEFYVLAILVGFVQGGIQALSRSYFSRLIPPGKSAQFFGFYNMVGKCSTILGPALMGTFGYITGNPRAGIGVLSLFFIVGGLLLCLVKEEQSSGQ